MSSVVGKATPRNGPLKTTQPEPAKWKISFRASKSARKPAPVSLPKMSWDKDKRD